jgi:PAS domain S-box-containing protein
MIDMPLPMPARKTVHTMRRLWDQRYIVWNGFPRIFFLTLVAASNALLLNLGTWSLLGLTAPAGFCIVAAVCLAWGLRPGLLAAVLGGLLFWFIPGGWALALLMVALAAVAGWNYLHIWRALLGMILLALLAAPLLWLLYVDALAIDPVVAHLRTAHEVFALIAGLGIGLLLSTFLVPLVGHARMPLPAPATAHLTGAAATLALLLLLAVHIGLIATVQRTAEYGARDLLMVHAQNTFAAFDQQIARIRESVLRELGQPGEAPSVGTADGTADTQALVQGLRTIYQQFQPAVNAVMFGAPDGTGRVMVYAAHEDPIMIGESFANRNYYQALVHGAPYAVSTRLTGRIDQEPVQVVAVALPGQDGALGPEMAGWVAVGIHIEELTRLLPASMRDSTTLHWVITDQQDEILATNLPALSGYVMLPDSLRSLPDETITYAPPDSMLLADQHTTSSDVLVWSQRATNGWRVIVEVPLSGVLRDLPAIQARVWSLGTITLVVVLLFVITIGQRTDQQLNESQSRYRRLIEHAPDLIYRYEMVPRRGFSFVNDAAQHIIGYTPDEHYADPELGLKIVHPDDQAVILDFIRQPPPKATTFLLRWYHKNGHIVWVEGRLMTVYDIKGQAIALEGIARDVTERKQAEEEIRCLNASLEQRVIERTAELQQSQSLLQAFLDHVPALIYAKDIQGRYLLANTQLLSLLQVQPEQFIGQHEREMFPAEIIDTQNWSGTDQQVINSGQPLAYEHGPHIGEDTMMYLTTKFPIYDAQGVVYATGGISTDITERTRAEEALRASEERLRLLVESMPVLIDAFDAEGRIVVWNGECERVTGYTADEIIHNDRVMEMLYPDPDYRTQLLKQFASINTVLYDKEWDITCKDGSIRTIAWSNISHKFPIPGWSTWAIGIDVTERRKAQAQLQRYAAELEQRAEESRQFVYIVSHDMRAPLVNVKGFASELRSALDVIGTAAQAALPHLPEGQQQEVNAALLSDIPEALSFIDASTNQMNHLINALLKLSRLGRRELYLEPLNMQRLVAESLQALAHQLTRQQVQVYVDTLPEVVADETAMEQIIGNILHNAVLYLDPQRRGVIDIGSQQRQDETLFYIRDNGRGIAAEDISKVFAPFRRIGKQDIAGEGMGMAYVQALVRRHGGRIWCESEPGIGTTFFFTIPHRTTEEASHGEL